MTASREFSPVHRARISESLNKLSPWTDDRVETLKKLHATGKSASVIAEMLGDGISRSAVIGKLHRLGIAKPDRQRAIRDNSARCKAQSKRRLLMRPITPPAEPLPAPRVDDIARVSFEGLESHHCRFGVGDPKQPDFGFCGLQKVPGKAYCEGHLHRCTTGVDYVPRVHRMHEKVARGDRTEAATAQEFLEPA